jgi:hypothetical protein
MEITILLLAMVGQGVARQLAASDAVSKVIDRQEERIYAGLFLKQIENLLDALIHERHGADLNGNYFLPGSRGRLLRGGSFRSGNSQTGHGGSQKFSSFHNPSLRM